jgi:hypothetical protein
VPLGLEQGVRLVGVDQPAEQVRELAPQVPRLVVLEPPGVALEQQRRDAGVLDLLEDGPPVARLDVAGQVDVLAVDVQPAADLVDVGGLAEQPRVLHHLRLAPPRLEHDLHARAVAGLERPRGQQREGALVVAEQRGAAP